MRKLLSFLLLGLVLLPCLTPPLRSAEPAWHTLQAPHFLIVSQRPERETREWATQFEQFILTLRDTLRFDEAALPPLTVVLFANESRFSSYRPVDAKGRPRAVAGFFASRDTWSVIALPGGFVDEQTRRVVLHEATHWLISSTRTELPLWLNEGFAEVFSSIEIRKDHVLLGQPIEHHVATLQGSSWAPLLQLMLTGGSDRLYTDSERNRFFYGESWLFVHRLLFRDRKAGYEALNRFFEARVHGTDQITAFRQAFGQSPEAADGELLDYFRHGNFRLTKLPLPQANPVQTPFRPATAYEVEIALARVAQGTGLTDRARQHVDRALALDAAPPQAHELLAFLENQQKHQAAARAAAQAALDRGSHDAWINILAADALWDHYHDRGEVAEKSREIAALYLAAARFQPNLRAPYLAFAQLARSFPTATQDDATFLGDGYARFPEEAALLVGLAVLLQKGHNLAEATRVIDLALARGDRLTVEQRSQAERLRVQWQIEPLARRLDSLVDERDFAAALALCDRILEQPLHYDDRDRWQQRRGDLRFQLALAAVAAKAGDGPASVLRGLEELLADPELNASQRAFVRRQLDDLRRRTGEE